MRESFVAIVVAGLVGLASPVAAEQPRAKPKTVPGMAGRAALTFGPGNVGKGMPANLVRRVLFRNKRKLRACFNPSGINRHKYVKVVFAIPPSGKVVMAQTRGADPRMRGCIEATLRGIQFPKPQGNKTVPVFYELRYVGAPLNIRGGTGMPGTIGPGRIGGGGPRIGGGLRLRPRSTPARLRLAGPIRVQGGLDRAIVRRYLRRTRRRLMFCYERRLLVIPKLRGMINVRFVLSPVGKVLRAVTKGFDGGVDKCISTAIRAIRFPKPRSAGVTIIRVRYRATPPQATRRGPSEFVSFPGFRGKLVSKGGLGARFRPHAVVRTRAKQLLRCYTRVAQSKKGGRAKVTTRFNVRADGKPVSLIAWGTRPVAGCVAYQMRKLRFPPGNPLMKVVYQLRYGTPRKPRR